MSEFPALNCSNFVIKYLGEMETEFKNTLACLSGTQMGSNHEKNGGQKSLDTLPLNNENVVKVVKWTNYISKLNWRILQNQSGGFSAHHFTD